MQGLGDRDALILAADGFVEGVRSILDRGPCQGADRSSEVLRVRFGAHAGFPCLEDVLHDDDVWAGGCHEGVVEGLLRGCEGAHGQPTKYSVPPMTIFATSPNGMFPASTTSRMSPRADASAA